MTAEAVSRWARRFVISAAGWLVVALLAVVLGLPHATVVVCGLYGFVLHTVFGKAYSLVPTYFDRQIASSVPLGIQLPLTVGGTALLALSRNGFLALPLLDTMGATLWLLGVLVFVGTIGWTIRDNLTGGETATGEANAERRPVDRLANLFVPVALLYLVVGSYGTLASTTPILPVLVDGYAARLSHLLAAGTGALLVFAIGFRLLPRFLVARPPRPLVPVVLGAGSLGPALIAVGLPSGSLLHAGAALEAVAVLGYAITVAVLLRRSPRKRVGFYGVGAGALLGVLSVLLGLLMVFGGLDGRLLIAHARLNLFGFLGLTIVGVSYQFYPPTVGTFPGASDRTAAFAIGFIAVGLLLHATGIVANVTALGTGGAVLALLGGVAHAGLLAGLFVERYGER